MGKGRKEGRRTLLQSVLFPLTFPGEYKSISKYIHIPNSGNLTNKVKSEKEVKLFSTLSRINKELMK